MKSTRQNPIYPIYYFKKYTRSGSNKPYQPKKNTNSLELKSSYRNSNTLF